MMEIFEYEFMRNALAAAALVSIACGVVGTFVVIRKIVFISGGIAHAAFGGIGLGYLVGISPIVAAIPFSVMSALGIGILSKKADMGEDAAIGVLWTLGMASGVVFIHMSQGYAPDLFSYLFGSILTVPRQDLAMMGILDVLIVVGVLLFYKELVGLSFDEEFSTVVGVPAQQLNLLLLCLVGLSVVTLIRVVGVILVIALLTMPAAIGRYFTYDVKRMMILSVGIGVIGTVAGLFISYAADLPSGATIVLILGGMLLCSTILKNVWRGRGYSHLCSL
ncbi:MAG: metal ABC transporter permease [Theionarchaea archaeon]|nr:metal ABC transporter permease [Theionarchaea archaeon]MBU7000470.1 metal ABC transporter permease [Theionarchaea archaeon]MBU7020003.1 metal ABC transporter permease [Theionarchaea archaeon]MBU7035254.1 metal ABC transporter permease [Theionarchaea archaeon]MBU7040573.1 metal ABC transporter permease [Theionarchaea archaeon]